MVFEGVCVIDGIVNVADGSHIGVIGSDVASFGHLRG
jgi:hypothetical protein